MYVSMSSNAINSQPGSIYLDPDTLIAVLCVFLPLRLCNQMFAQCPDEWWYHLLCYFTLQIAENLSHSTTLFLNWYMNHNKTKRKGKVYNHIRFLIVCFTLDPNSS